MHKKGPKVVATPIDVKNFPNVSPRLPGGAFLCDVEGKYGLGCLGCKEEGYGRCCKEVEFFRESGLGIDCVLFLLF